MNARLWMNTTCGCVAAVLLVIAGVTVWIDPYFHYHAPHVDKYWYALDNERCQNDGIVRHFDYAALVTGTSMMENCKASDVEEKFGLRTVKTCFSGASYKELRNLVLTAIENRPQLQLIIIGLDQDRLLISKDWMRTDLGIFPDYLYDRNPLNDVCYVFNKDVLNRIVKLLHSWDWPGRTSFDDYSRWGGCGEVYGRAAVLGDRRLGRDWGGGGETLSAGERQMVQENIEANIKPILLTGKKVIFVFTPGSIVQRYRCFGKRTVEAEAMFCREIVKYPHAKIFSFNTCSNLVTNLNHYNDVNHYGPWVNSQMLDWIKFGKGEITRDNLEDYLTQELALYSSFDFTVLNDQADEPDDQEAAQMLKEAKW